LPDCAHGAVGASRGAQRHFPDLATEADGDFVVVRHRPGSVSTDVFFRLLTSAGVGLASDARINVFTSGAQSSATVDLAGDGGFVVAWTTAGQDGDSNGVFGRRFDAAGTALATEFQVNAVTLDSQYDPALAVDADGDFVVVWSKYIGAKAGASGTPIFVPAKTDPAAPTKVTGITFLRGAQAFNAFKTAIDGVLADDGPSRAAGR
jgi:hypothetical protein